MASVGQCCECGAGLPADSPGGLCPVCLFRLAAAGVPEQPTVAEAPADEAGLRFGPYTTVRLLGEGGMGIVYLARQEQPLQRTVALKVVKLGLDSREVAARFETERQSLALMDHPNIARVFDAGTSEDGRPYFVMEYVPGVPITHYCDTNGLSNRERLELFRQVCLAIHHAHQKGVIHRDLKPSNVLVTVQDGKPVPKVIDFGVAKATSQRLAERTVFTDQGKLIGTPEYMSPEQAGFGSEDVDTATDIYSLGVLLYELIAGALPFDIRELRRAGYFEMLRVIREQDPPSPTARFRTLGAAASEIAKRHHTDLRTLERQLRGDLEWITMRALEKERARRYASASELAADIGRHLNDEPVHAGPPSRVYRLRKFVRKNRGAVAAVAAIIFCLAAGLAASTVLYLREQRERDAAERQSYVANLASADALIEAADYEGARERLFLCAPRLRGWEWRLLYGLSDTTVATLYGTGDSIKDCPPSPRFAFSPDGKRVFFHMLRTVHAWSVPSWQPAGDFGPFGRILVLSSDGSQVVTLSPASQDSELNVIEVLSGRRLAMLRNASKPVSAAFSPDGSLIASISEAGDLQIWHTTSGGLVASARTPAVKPYRHSELAFSPGNRFVVCSVGPEAHIFDAHSGKRVRTLKTRARTPAVVSSLGFSLDGTRIAIGDNVGAVRIWDLTSDGTTPKVLFGGSLVEAVGFSPNGRQLLTATASRAVRVWDADGGAVLGTLAGNTGDRPIAVAFSPDAQWILAGSQSGEVWIWNAKTYGGSILAPAATTVNVAQSRDGRRIAVGTSDHTAVLAMPTGQVLVRAPVPARSVAFNPAGDRLAVGTPDGRMAIVDAHTGAILLTWQAHERQVISSAFNPDGRKVASGSSDFTARIWDAANGEQLRNLQFQGPVKSAIFSPDGKLLATAVVRVDGASAEAAVYVWEATSGRLAWSLAPLTGGHGQGALAFSPDGKQLAASGTDDVVRLFDSTTGDTLAVLNGPKYGSLALTFSPDGSLIAAAALDNSIRFWDARRHEVLFTLRRAGTVTTDLAFSPDGARLYGASADSAFQPEFLTLRVWDTSNAVHSNARELVARLARKYPLTVDVRRHIENDPRLDEPLRSSALRFCWPTADHMGVNDVLPKLLTPNRIGVDLRLALRRSEDYSRLAPSSVEAALTLGAAQYRNQMYEEAARTLSRVRAAGHEDPAAEAFLAMAWHRTGRIGEAHDSLDRAHSLLKNTDGFRRRVSSAIVAEAEALVARKAH